MSEFMAKTYCDFGDADRKDELSSHFTIETAKRQFARKAKIYNGIHKWRVWTEVLSSGQIICDTNLITS